MRLSRFQWTTLVMIAAAVSAWFGLSGALRWAGLSVIFTTYGLLTGLGVSFPQWQWFGRSLCRVETSQKAVALTFDDGPDPDATPGLLDLLDRRGIKATFFCVGEKVRRHPEIVRRAVAAGHLVANHSQRHLPWTNLLSVPALREDLQQARSTIREVTGSEPLFYRPPMGLTNPRVFRVVSELGLSIVGYTVRGYDRRKGADAIVARLLNGVRPGAILLLHDGGVPAERLPEITDRLITGLQREGYCCLRLDELIACGRTT
jgi:peptidoglycan/xylan/chitin deacetylase (PgdA/CDA1 family)